MCKWQTLIAMWWQLTCRTTLYCNLSMLDSSHSNVVHLYSYIYYWWDRIVAVVFNYYNVRYDSVADNARHFSRIERCLDQWFGYVSPDNILWQQQQQQKQWKIVSHIILPYSVEPAFICNIWQVHGRFVFLGVLSSVTFPMDEWNNLRLFEVNMITLRKRKLLARNIHVAQTKKEKNIDMTNNKTIPTPQTIIPCSRHPYTHKHISWDTLYCTHVCHE